MDRILLRGLTFFGRHGCLPAERELGQPFVVDIEVECDLRRAGETDDLNDTLDYVSLLNKAREIVEGPPVALLETLAARIAEFALSDARAVSVRVRIIKPHVAVPTPIEFLGVEIVRVREPS